MGCVGHDARAYASDNFTGRHAGLHSGLTASEQLQEFRAVLRHEGHQAIPLEKVACCLGSLYSATMCSLLILLAHLQYHERLNRMPECLTASEVAAGDLRIFECLSPLSFILHYPIVKASAPEGPGAHKTHGLIPLYNAASQEPQTQKDCVELY